MSAARRVNAKRQQDRPILGSLKISANLAVHPDDVDYAAVRRSTIRVFPRFDPGYTVRAPYFAAWLDRLGIPWTEELRKAHAAAGKGEA